MALALHVSSQHADCYRLIEIFSRAFFLHYADSIVPNTRFVHTLSFTVKTNVSIITLTQEGIDTIHTPPLARAARATLLTLINIHLTPVPGEASFTHTDRTIQHTLAYPIARAGDIDALVYQALAVISSVAGRTATCVCRISPNAHTVLATAHSAIAVFCVELAEIAGEVGKTTLITAPRVRTQGQAVATGVVSDASDFEADVELCYHCIAHVECRVWQRRTHRNINVYWHTVYEDSAGEPVIDQHSIPYLKEDLKSLCI